MGGYVTSKRIIVLTHARMLFSSGLFRALCNDESVWERNEGVTTIWQKQYHILPFHLVLSND